MNPAEWPWYEVVEDDSLDQGDIIPGCLVLHAVEGEDSTEAVADLRPVTALVLTQTCDLAQSKVESVVVCAVWPVTRVVLQDPVLRKEAADTAQRSKLAMPSVEDPDADAGIRHAGEARRNPGGAPVDGQKANPRLRLLPPYREHISQAFGRYFSRIGLLQDIPRYTT